MRVFLTLAVLCLLLAPAAGASKPLPVNPYADPEVTVSPAGCDLCVDAGLDAGTVPEPNCADCGAYGANVDAHAGTDGVGLDAAVCFSGFYYVCYVDESVFLSPPA